MKRFFKGSYFAIIMAFIYIPIVVMVLFSFNSGQTTVSWVGFSFDWYSELFNNSPFIKSIVTSLFVAVVSTVLSVIIGTLAAIGLSRTKKVTQKSWFGIANIPLINADVVTAVSLMIIFLLAGIKFGIMTLILAHVSFNVPYVLITVMPRLRKVDKSLIEASYDLGAKNLQVLFRIILPILKPAIISATAIAFAMSFDDFIISYFTGGDQTNVSTFIYTAKKVKPYIFAFGTILVLIIVLAIIGWNAIFAIKQHRLETEQRIKNGAYKSKKIQRLNKELEALIRNNETKTEVSFTWRLSLWIKYWTLKLHIAIASSKNYDKRIAKLEWKQYKLRSEISKEKRYFSRLTKAEKKLVQLNKQLNSTKIDIKKAAKISIQIEKLAEKIEFLRDEIEWINHRDELAAKKAAKIQKEIDDFYLDLSRETNPTKKTIVWYNKKIKELQDWKIEVEEGKNHYRLRMVVEQLKEVRDHNYNQLTELMEKLNVLYAKVFPVKSMTKYLDKQIAKETRETERLMLIETRNEKLAFKTSIYEQKIERKKTYIETIKLKVEEMKEKLFPSNLDDISYTKGFIARTWKVFLVTLLGLAAFTGLTVAYVMNNIYDLVVANWGEYIDPALITKFEKANNVKVNYQVYDSNETLYNKLFTFNYDVMVPSDYMIQKLAQEGRLLKLDYSKLNVNGMVNHQPLNELNDFDGQEIDESLLNSMYNSKVEETEFNDEIIKNPNSSVQGSILEYSIPYFWGDLAIIVKPTKSNIEFLAEKGILDADGKIINSKLSWQVLWDAAAAGKDVALNSDPKNIFAMASELLYQKVNLDNKQEVDSVVKKVTDLVHSKNVALNGDDLINKVSSGNFDFAMMYNGDAAFANTEYSAQNNDENFLFGRPNQEHNGRYETTNVFSDNVAISKTAKNKDLAYKFLNFLFEKSSEITEFVGITSPFVDAMNYMTEEGGTYSSLANLYNPIIKESNNYNINGTEPLAFLYNGKVDDYLVDKFNSIVAGKK